MKKKILMLGGSAQQVVAIETAKRLGYETVLCDFLPDNPGQYHADHFYLVSTTDKQAVLQVAEKEKIDGIIAYASDPAAPTAAWIAEKLNLPGNPFESVETLCSKDRFRTFLRENGFNAPQSGGYSMAGEARKDFARFRLPVIIKPVDSSGSKGATVLRSAEGLHEAIDFAFSFSRAHRIIIEEFVEKKHPYLIGGDVFIENGKIILWGLLNCHRDPAVNPLVPVGKSYPLQLDPADEKNVRDTLQRMVDKLHLRSCAMNVELIVDAEGRVWPIDVGPRNGGNMIPDLLSMIFDVDVVEMSVQAAMGCTTGLLPGEGRRYYATHNLHTEKNGHYRDIVFDPALEQVIVKKCLYKTEGDEISYFDNAAKALGIIFMRFDSEEAMKDLLGRIHSLYRVRLTEEHV